MRVDIHLLPRFVHALALHLGGDAGSSRPTLDNMTVPHPLRLRKTGSLQKEQGGVVMWDPALEPPRPSNAHTLTMVEEMVSPTGIENTRSMFSSNYSAAGELSQPETAPTAEPWILDSPAIQQAHAASIQMAVNNCHMLQYRLSRVDEVSAPGAPTELELVANPALKAPASIASQRAAMLQKKTPIFGSAKVANNKVQPALVTITAGETTPHHASMIVCLLSHVSRMDDNGLWETACAPVSCRGCNIV